MAQDTSLEGLRSQMVKSFYGRRDGLDKDDFSVGAKDVRIQVEGVSSAGSTMISTVATSVGSTGHQLSGYGISLVGATGASASTFYQLGAPTPGTYKTLFNPTTGAANISTTASGAYICSTASITSTHQQIAMSGKGCNLQMIGLTTGLWAALVAPASSNSTNITFS